MSKSNRLKQLDRTPMVPRQPEHAFTLIELLVVLAMVTLLAMTLLPALAKAKYPSMVSNCAANFRQWVEMANVYASDDAQGNLPSFVCCATGGDATDVATNFIPNLVPYGMTIAMNFCPVRSGDLDVANAQFKNGYGNLPAQHRYIQNIADFNLWVCKARSNNGGYSKLIHLWWVPRETNLLGFGLPQSGGSLFPWPGYPAGNAPAGAVPWPSKLSDKSARLQPVISDLAEYNGTSTDPNVLTQGVPGISLGQAHFYNGTLQSVNAAYADGHVETHTRENMAWQYTGNLGSQSYFY
jgi:prepilin-type N-terminal cleavage/methylation domain-containing protein/prepilin-type processing-associated H-X9-DG protein